MINGRKKNNSTEAQGFFEHGKAHLKQGDFDEAVKDFTKAIQLSPKFTDAYYHRSYIYFQKEDWKAAIQDLDEMIRCTLRHLA